MKNRFLALVVLATALYAAPVHTLRARGLRTRTGLEIYTETGGSPEIDPQGIIGLSGGSKYMANRIVVDRTTTTVLFAYSFRASRW